jgi:ABC-type sugar transport system permease subunit
MIESTVQVVRLPRIGRSQSLHHRARRNYWLFCVPALALLIVVIGVPVAYTVHLSTLHYSLLNGTQSPAGLANYKRALTDPGVWRALERTAIYIVVTGALDFAIGMIQALIVFQLKGRLAKIVKGFFILPILLIPSVSAIFWQMIMYGPPYEEFNRLFGISLNVPLLGGTSTALIGIMITAIWAWSPWSFLLLSSGLESLNREILEAAAIDGAGFLTVVRRMIFPLLRPVIFVTVAFKAVVSLNTFAFPWAMTRGGPGGSSHVLATYIYQNSFGLFNYGYGAAASILMLILGVGAAAMVSRLASRTRYA